MAFLLPPVTQLHGQTSWLLKDTVNELKGNQSTYIKLNQNFITPKKLPPPILRIMKFLKVGENNEITATLADSTHKIFAKFPFKPTIINFENTYNQRMTYCTTNSLILVKKAELLRVRPEEIRRNYDDLIVESIDYLVLNILDLEIYNRDQISLNSDVHLKYIYQMSEYCHLSKRVSIPFECDDDGVVSS